MNGTRPPIKKAGSTYELGQRAGEQILAAFGSRRDIQTSAIEWYRGFSKGLGGQPLPQVEAFIVEQCRRLAKADKSPQMGAELAILDVLAQSPLDFLPGIDEPLPKRRRANASR